MITFRPAGDRGHADHGWLNAYHSFSFSGYHDPRWMGYGSLRVINEDRIAAHTGFPTHPHKDMEIITYVMQGQLQHKDSTGGEGVLKPGEIQVMSAGRGIRHSEANSGGTQTHLLQIWIEPNRLGVEPGYQQSTLDASALRAGFTTVVAPHGENAPFHIHQDARLAIAWARPGQKLDRVLNPERRYYLHIARGGARLDTHELAGGDAAMIEGEDALRLTAGEDSEILLFDLTG